MTEDHAPGAAPDRGLTRRGTAFGAFVCWLAAAMLAGPAFAAKPPAPPPPASAPPANLSVEDPLEGMNRAFYAVHQTFDHLLFRPVAMGYVRVVPHPVRTGLHNLVTTLSEPIVFGNYVLQLRIARAAKTAGRFVINATVGLGGLLDPAAKVGLPHHDNGFGDTLGHYGIAPGPYVFLPLIGPSDFRDLIGEAMDFYSDPLSQVHYPKRGYVQAGTWIIGGIDQRANAEPDLQRIQEMGTDSYATLRSLYLQNRDSEIHEHKALQIENLPSLDDPSAPPAPASPSPSAAPPSRPQPGAAPAATDPAAAAPSVAWVFEASPEAGAGAPNALAPPAPEWVATWPRSER